MYAVGYNVIKYGVENKGLPIIPVLLMLESMCDMDRECVVTIGLIVERYCPKAPCTRGLYSKVKMCLEELEKMGVIEVGGDLEDRHGVLEVKMKGSRSWVGIEKGEYKKVYEIGKKIGEKDKRHIEDVLELMKVYCVVKKEWKYWGSKGQDWCVSLDRLEKKMGMNIKTVERYLKVLEGEGMIWRNRGERGVSGRIGLASATR